MKQMYPMRSILRTVAIALTAALVVAVPVMAQEATPEGTSSIAILPNIVLVHGAFAEGASWNAVIEQLQAAGYNAIAPQFPLTSLAADVARLREVLAHVDGPTILVGHSYGGQIITALGADAPNVVGLVYIAGFGLDEGESVAALGAGQPPAPALANLQVDALGMAWLPQDDFLNHFAADVDPVKAKVMWATQQPVSLSVFADVMTAPSWKSFPSWYMVATNDEAIAPDAERLFAKRMNATTVEIESSHVPMVSHPNDVTKLIEQAAESVKVGA